MTPEVSLVRVSDIEDWLTDYYKPLLEAVMLDALRAWFKDWLEDLFCQPPAVFIEKAKAILAEIEEIKQNLDKHGGDKVR